MISSDRKVKIMLILSESPLARASGGGVAGFERACALAEVADLRCAYVDWDRAGEVALPLAVPIACRPLSPVARGILRFLSVTRRAHKVFGSLINRGPWFFGLFSMSSVAKQCESYLRESGAGLVCFDNIPSTLAWEACAGRKRIYFAHNVESDVVQYTFPGGWLQSMERNRILAWERKVVREADAVICFTERDSAALRRLAPGQRFEVIPPAFGPPPKRAWQPTLPAYVIMPTNAAWEPNRLSLEWFRQEVLPKVPRDIRFVLTGRDRDGFLARMAEGFQNVEYAGLLPREEYEAKFLGARLFVNPTRFGSGFQIKLMEAVRFGVPAISTAFSNHLGDLISATDDGADMARRIDEWMRFGTGMKHPMYEGIRRDALDRTRDLIASV
ncbi:MAG: glycosyltransferase [Opitutaceae bacterium]|nr:glycosyltransferase [Opitutaceae bacterium]